MTREELILELKDISPPVEPGWWLIAPGYLIIALSLVSLFALLWFIVWRRHSQRRFTLAKQELERIRLAHEQNGDSLQLARDLAQWLKRVSLSAFPESRLESASGRSWLVFLDRTLGNNSFTRGAGRVFADAIYQRQASPDSACLLTLCRRWLVAVKPRLIRREQGR